MVTRHRTGGEVDAFCTKCKMLLAHTIVAMVGDKIVRVKCNTCGGDHSYRGAPDARPASTRSAAAARPAREKVEKVIISFEQQLADKDVANAPAYNVRETFQVDQVIRHPTFGIGLVTAVRGDKMDVAFKAETKTLVHGRGGAPAARPSFQPPTRGSASGPADKPMSDVAPDAPAGSEQSEGSNSES